MTGSEKKMNRIESQATTDNLIFCGIQEEPNETMENTQELISGLIKDTLNMSDDVLQVTKRNRAKRIICKKFR